MSVFTPITKEQAVSVTRASTGYGQTVSGQSVSFGTNQARITDQGMLIEPAATNINQYSADHPHMTGYGSTPPAIGHDVMFDGLQGVSISFDQNSNSGFGGSRATHQTLPFAIMEGTEYTASYQLKLSRQLLVGEVIQIFIAGGYSNWGFQVNAYKDFTIAKPVQVSHLVASGGASNVHFVVFAVTSMQAPVTVYMGNRQFETGSKATSHIPTSGSSATRSADLVRADKVALSLATMTQGILCLDITIPDTTSAPARLMEISDGTQNNVVSVYINSSGHLNTQCSRAGVQTHDVSALQNIAAGRNKIAIGFDGTNFSHSVNGSTPVFFTDILPFALSVFTQTTLGASLDGNVEMTSLHHGVNLYGEQPLAARLSELSTV